MAIRFDEIGRRLRAYRFGKGLTASEVAEQIGVSRAAIYRLEKGELIKIETIEKLSELLDVSLPSLMGVGVEYYNNSISFFERLRQLEAGAVHVLGNFSPLSFLLLSDDYLKYLRLMLIEAIPQGQAEPPDKSGVVDRLLEILRERRVIARKRQTPIVSIVNAHDVERFVRFGLVGRFDLAPAIVDERRQAARAEIERFIGLIHKPPLGTQVGIIEDIPSAQTFQVFEKSEGSAVTLSPYRLGDHPNISSGIAMVTTAPEAVRLFKDTITRQWDIAHKGERAAQILRAIIDRAAVNGLPAGICPVDRMETGV